MNDNFFKDTSARMEKTIEALQSNMTKIRTGRANASLLDHVMVPYYGTDTPLNQVASVSASDGRTLAVSPWDKSLMAAIEKAIQTSDLGLNPVPYEGVIRVPIPPLTEDRRKQLVKVIKDEAEQSKVGIRTARRDANTHIKSQNKDKEISDDEAKEWELQVQKLTDDCIAKIEALVKVKEQDVMSV
jgi:ribosome recycling factor